MASVTSQTSPHSSPYDFDSTGDTDESWQYIDYSSGASAAGSVVFLSSPASGSLSGYALVGHTSQHTPPQASVSPLSLVETGRAVYLSHATSPHTVQMGTSNSNQMGRLEDAALAPNNSFLSPAEYMFAQPDDVELTEQELNGKLGT